MQAERFELHVVVTIKSGKSGTGPAAKGRNSKTCRADPRLVGKATPPRFATLWHCNRSHVLFPVASAGELQSPSWEEPQEERTGKRDEGEAEAGKTETPPRFRICR